MAAKSKVSQPRFVNRNTHESLGELSLRSWQDFACECFCFGSEAVNTSGEVVRGLVKSRVEFPPAQIRGVF